MNLLITNATQDQIDEIENLARVRRWRNVAVADAEPAVSPVETSPAVADAEPAVDLFTSTKE